jgi:hypothetical protein
MTKKINIALGTLLALSAAPSIALADSADNFKGPNLSLGLGVQTSTFKTQEQGAGTWAGSGSASSYSGTFSYDRQIEWPNDAAKFGGKAELGYNFKLSENFLLGASLAGDFTKLLSGTQTSSTTGDLSCGSSTGTFSVVCGTSAGTGGSSGSSSTGGFTDTASSTLRSLTNEMTLKNRFGFALRPMFVITDQTAFYLKLSYNIADASGFASTVRVHGPGYGAGFETNLSESWFLRAEIEQISYSGSVNDQAATIGLSGFGGTSGVTNTTTYTSGKYTADMKSTFSMISIGYRF